jgi:hypothetical protein
VKARSRKCNVETAKIITLSPFKNELEQKSLDKNRKREKKSRERQLDHSNHAAGTSAKNIRKKTKLSVPAATILTEKTPCCVCAVRYCDPLFDDWQQCAKCCAWYHVSHEPDDTDICYNCLD